GADKDRADLMTTSGPPNLACQEVAPIHATERRFEPEVVAANLLDHFEREPNMLRRRGFRVLGLSGDDGLGECEMLLKQMNAHTFSLIQLRAVVEDVVAEKIR